MHTQLSPDSQRGTSLIEVLVTIVILAVGLMGLMGLQGRLQIAEMESYQRVQATILAEDMANRIAANRAYAANYVTGTDESNILGANLSSCPTTTTSSTQQQKDFSEWCNALKGAAEISSGNKIGAMIGGRGCIEQITGSNEYRVTVAWQGMAPTGGPSGVSCGSSQYTGETCTGDLCRRAVITLVRIAPL